MTAHHTDFVRNNREMWFRTVPSAREAYLTDGQIRLTVDSVDAALSLVDREMAAEGVDAATRRHILTVAVFGRPEELEEYHERARLNRAVAEHLAAPLTPEQVQTLLEKIDKKEN